jgi:hypothetical protein
MRTDLPFGRIVIDRLDLDLRGIDRNVAEAALPLIGAALQGRLGNQSGPAVALAQRIATGLTAQLAPHAPFALSLSKCPQGLRQAQPERGAVHQQTD